MMPKRPLILFSGGLDSTAALIHALYESDVDVVSVTTDDVGELKCSEEQKARHAILIKLDQLYNTRTIEHRVICKYDVKANLPHPRRNYSGLQQVELWLTSAMGMIDPDIHSHVQVAYVKGDCAIAFLPQISALWDNFYQFRRELNCQDEVKLYFPFQHLSKETLMKSLVGHNHEWVFDLVWTCELPVKLKRKITPCGRCIPCVSDAAAKLKYALSLNRTTTAAFYTWLATQHPPALPTIGSIVEVKEPSSRRKKRSVIRA